MHEYGAPQISAARSYVVVEHDYQVIDAVVAPQPFSTCWIGMAYRSVVIAISDCVAPAVARRDGADRQSRPRAALRFGIEKNLAHGVPAQRGRAVALTL